MESLKFLKADQNGKGKIIICGKSSFCILLEHKHETK